MRAVPTFAAAALAACEPSRPYETSPPEPPPPLTGASPLRITYNSAADWRPAFTPDGAQLWYSFQVPGRPDRDRCVAKIPAAGGRQSGTVCWRGAGELDSTDAVVLAAESPSGRLAFVAERGGRNATVPTGRALLASPPGDPDRASLVMTFPRTGNPFAWYGIGDMWWLDDSTLLLVPQLYAYSGTTPGSSADTTISGIEVARVDLRTSPASLRIYGLTRFASSAAPGPTPGTAIFTIGGDTRVFELNLATGSTTVLYDFAPIGIPRDVRMVGDRLFAVVAGKVYYNYEPLFGMGVQRDWGGPVYMVDVQAGTPPRLLTLFGRFYRHLAAAPDGASLVAEGYAVTIVSISVTEQDTIVSENGDLFVIQVP